MAKELQKCINKLLTEIKIKLQKNGFRYEKDARNRSLDKVTSYDL